MEKSREVSVGFVLNSLSPAFQFIQPRKIDFDAIDWEFVRLFCEKNNILLQLAKYSIDNFSDSLPARVREEFSTLNAENEARLEDIRQALYLVEDLFPAQHILLKTYRGLPRIPSDIDFLVPDYEAGIDICREAGLRWEPSGHKELKTNFFTERNVNLHLHGRVEWADREFMDIDFILNSPRRVKFNDVEVSIPNFNADYLMHFAHMSYESLHVTLAELPYLMAIEENANETECLHQAKKYHWVRSFRRSSQIVRQLQQQFLVPPESEKSEVSNTILPYTLPRLHLILSFLERGVIVEPLLKLPKVVKVLLTGDAYRGFYQPAEDQSRWKIPEQNAERKL